MRKKAVVLLSGGLDSAVTLAVAKQNGFKTQAVTFDYGQRHVMEIESAKKVAESVGVERHKVVKLSTDIFGGSALTGGAEMPDPRSMPGPGTIPLTYVPARNTVFLSIALAWAESLGARDLFIGVSAVDYSGYPDCRPEYIEQFERLANLGTRAADTGEKFKIHAPLVKMTKAQTVQIGLDLGVDFGSTWSCYNPTADGWPCQRCEACLLRARGFERVGHSDPLLRGLTRC